MEEPNGRKRMQQRNTGSSCSKLRAGALVEVTNGGKFLIESHLIALPKANYRNNNNSNNNSSNKQQDVRS
jgi:hypothetical protein